MLFCSIIKMVRVVKSLSYRKAGIGFGRRIDSSAEESNLQPKNYLCLERVRLVESALGGWLEKVC